MSWIMALQKYNEGKKWSIPKKGSPEHAQVMAIKDEMVGSGISINITNTKKKKKVKNVGVNKKVKVKVEKKPKVVKSSSKKKSKFRKMELITPKHIIDFNLIITLKNEMKGESKALEKSQCLSALSPFNSIMDQLAIQDMIKGSGLSLYGAGEMKGKLKKLTNKDRKSLNSLVKQNNLSMGEVFSDKALDILQNPTQALVKVFNATKALGNNLDNVITKNPIRLTKTDMSLMNKLLKSKSISDLAGQELTKKVDKMTDLFKQKIPGLAEKLMLGSGCSKPFKFSKKDIDEINKAAEQCECMTGAGLEDFFGKLLEDPVGNIKKLLNFQEANMGFKKLADTTQIGDKKPERLFKLPWQT